jgi:hypothetical protein
MSLSMPGLLHLTQCSLGSSRLLQVTTFHPFCAEETSTVGTFSLSVHLLMDTYLGCCEQYCNTRGNVTVSLADGFSLYLYPVEELLGHIAFLWFHYSENFPYCFL